MRPDRPGLICHCAQVSEDAVVAAYQAGCRTLREFQDATDACTGCRSCRPELEAGILACEASALAPSATQVDHMSTHGEDRR